MIAPAIQSFLSERKESRIKGRIKSCKTDEEIQELERNATEEFLLANWLPSAAKRSKQLAISSHPAKFTHSSAKTSAIIAQSTQKNDGFLRSANSIGEYDASGNAAAMDVYKFLHLQLEDGETILNHLELKTEVIEQQFTLPTASFDEIQQGLLAMKPSTLTRQVTDERVKQVYFPVDNGYHLLSLLTASGLIFKLKEKINSFRFSEESKQARLARKNKQHHEQGFIELYDLTMIGYGGTKPQTVSVLNNQNGGTAYLLQSLPPILKKRSINPPRKNFFSENLNTEHKYFKENLKEYFNELHKQLSNDTNNIHVRNKRDWIIKNIIYEVADRVWQIRYLEAGWSDSDRYENLSQNQKIWLDQQYKETRQQQTDWQDDIKSRLARWLTLSYEETQGKDKALSIGADEYKSHFIHLIEECEAALL